MPIDVSPLPHQYYLPLSPQPIPHRKQQGRRLRASKNEATSDIGGSVSEFHSFLHSPILEQSNHHFSPPHRDTSKQEFRPSPLEAGPPLGLDQDYWQNGPLHPQLPNGAFSQRPHRVLLAKQAEKQEALLRRLSKKLSSERVSKKGGPFGQRGSLPDIQNSSALSSRGGEEDELNLSGSQFRLTFYMRQQRQPQRAKPILSTKLKQLFSSKDQKKPGKSNGH